MISRIRVIIARSLYLLGVTIGDQSSITAGNLGVVKFNVAVLVEEHPILTGGHAIQMQLVVYFQLLIVICLIHPML